MARTRLRTSCQRSPERTPRSTKTPYPAIMPPRLHQPYHKSSKFKVQSSKSHILTLNLLYGRYPTQRVFSVPKAAVPGMARLGQGREYDSRILGHPLSFERLHEQVRPRLVVLNRVDMPPALLQQTGYIERRNARST